MTTLGTVIDDPREARELAKKISYHFDHSMLSDLGGTVVLLSKGITPSLWSKSCHIYFKKGLANSLTT